MRVDCAAVSCCCERSWLHAIAQLLWRREEEACILCRQTGDALLACVCSVTDKCCLRYYTLSHNTFRAATEGCVPCHVSLLAPAAANTHIHTQPTGALPAIVIGAVAVDVVGRRLTITTGLLITGLACSACALLGPGGWSTALASLGRSGCASAWSLAYLYAAELMPTSVRSAALAGGNQAAR